MKVRKFWKWVICRQEDWDTVAQTLVNLGGQLSVYADNFNQLAAENKFLREICYLHEQNLRKETVKKTEIN